jgi:hypothetical protein
MFSIESPGMAFVAKRNALVMMPCPLDQISVLLALRAVPDGTEQCSSMSDKKRNTLRAMSSKETFASVRYTPVPLGWKTQIRSLPCSRVCGNTDSRFMSL